MPSRSAARIGDLPIFSLGIYKVFRFRAPDGREHLAMTHGGTGAEMRGVDLRTGEILHITKDWLVVGKQVSKDTIEIETGYVWPTDSHGRPAGPETWPDPWSDLKHANPTFQAVMELLGPLREPDYGAGRFAHRLPLNDELCYLAAGSPADSDERAPQDRPPEPRVYSNDAEFCAYFITEQVQKGVPIGQAARAYVERELAGRQKWTWYYDRDFVHSAEEVWRRSGWAEGAKELPALLERMKRDGPKTAKPMLAADRKARLEMLARGVEPPRPRAKKTKTNPKGLTLQERLAKLEKVAATR